MAHFLVRYGEIGLKSEAVRRQFERRLMTNIEDAFLRMAKECMVTADRGHVYVEAEDRESAERVLSHTFGVTSFSLVDVVDADMGSISAHVEALSRRILGNGQSFAIRARRTGSHDFSSQDIAVSVGDAVRLANEDRGARVDLERPDVEFHIEVRMRNAYVSTSRVEGPGGMPYGSQGKVVALIGDEASALACWLVMRRGCSAIVLLVGGESEDRDRALAMLGAWTPKGRVVLGPALQGLTEQDLENAMDLAWTKKATAIVLGGTEAPPVKRNMPVFVPLAGLPDDLFDRFVAMLRT